MSSEHPAADTLEVRPLAVLRERRSEKWTQYPPDVLPAFLAELDFPLAPPVAAALRAAVARDDLGYVSARQPALFEAFAGFASRRLGWEVDPGQVTVVPDVMVGVAELLRTLGRDGASDAVVVSSPVYPPFFATVAEVGCRVVDVPLAPGDASLDLDGIAAALRAGARAVLLCNPQNPTGRVALRAQLEALAELAVAHGAWVLSDEIHAPLTLPGHAHVPFLTVSEEAAECGVAFTSASKAFNVAGLKAAVVVTASPRAAAQVARIPPEIAERTGLLGVLAAEAAFTEGDAWLDAAIATIDANQRRLPALLAGRLPGVACTPAQATYLAWLDCRALGLGDDPAAVFLERGRVALGRGLDFGPPGAGHARLTIGTSWELVEEAVSRMAAAVAAVAAG